MSDDLASRLSEHRKRMREIHARGLISTGSLAALNTKLILERGTVRAPEHMRVADQVVEELAETITHGLEDPRAAEGNVGGGSS
jgi:hypothetical protein